MQIGKSIFLLQTILLSTKVKLSNLHHHQNVKGSIWILTFIGLQEEELTVMNMDHDVLALARIDDDNDDNDDDNNDDDDNELTMMNMDHDVLALARVGGAVISSWLGHAAGPHHDVAGEVVRVALPPGLRPAMFVGLN